jgi:ABC-type transport system substrate-binding protein
MRGKVMGVNFSSADLGYRAFDSFLVAEISSEATRWRGANMGGYSNADFDQMHKRLFGTVNSSERDRIAADMVKSLLDPMLYLPLTYSGDVAAARKGLTGVTGVVALQRVTGWNIHVWDL